MSIRILSNELQKKSENEVNEVPKRIKDDLQHIREWIAKQSHLNVRKDDQWLLNFMRGCKFSLQKTKEKLDMYYTIRSMTPEFFANRDPFLPEIQEVLKHGIFLPLPKTVQPDGPRIVLIRCPSSVDPTKIPFINVIKMSMMIIDILINEDDNFVVAGQLGFLDLKGFTLNHAIHVTPTIAKKIVTCLQDAYPTRPKGFHFLNVPSVCENLINLVKPFIKAKIWRRIHFYSEKNENKVHKIIPRSVLPKEYGGENISISELTSEWKRKVESYRDWFMEDAKYCSNEKERPGIPKTSSCVFGIQGSFRKLDID